jgi:TRAP-type C4-dicarboxylate transport system permease small subunit
VGGIHPLRAQQRGIVAGAAAILLMIALTFIGGAACYRRRIHMNVSFFVLMLRRHCASLRN